MLSKLQRHLAKDFIKIFLRDQQSFFFSLFFPVIFMCIFALLRDGGAEPITIGVANQSDSILAVRFVEMLQEDLAFTVISGAEHELRMQLFAGDQIFVLVIPPSFSGLETGGDAPARLRLLADISQFDQLPFVTPMIEQKLMAIERDFSGEEAMFLIEIENVQVQSQSYLDFLMPGLLSMMLMQLSISGSGYRVVEYRLNGVLKRLFVTPIRPKDFIVAIVAARLGIVLLQLSILLAIVAFIFEVTILGSFFEFYLLAVFSCLMFLSIGFLIGSFARTQQTVSVISNVITLPQLILSGVFFPIDEMPILLQPFAQILPLTFVVSGLREIALTGAALIDLTPVLIGMTTWLLIALSITSRMFTWKNIAT